MVTVRTDEDTAERDGLSIRRPTVAQRIARRTHQVTHPGADAALGALPIAAEQADAVPSTVAIGTLPAGVGAVDARPTGSTGAGRVRAAHRTVPVGDHPPTVDVVAGIGWERRWKSHAVMMRRGVLHASRTVTAGTPGSWDLPGLGVTGSMNRGPGRGGAVATSRFVSALVRGGLFGFVSGWLPSATLSRFVSHCGGRRCAAPCECQRRETKLNDFQEGSVRRNPTAVDRRSRMRRNQTALSSVAETKRDEPRVVSRRPPSQHRCPLHRLPCGAPGARSRSPLVRRSPLPTVVYVARLVVSSGSSRFRRLVRTIGSSRSARASLP